MTLCDFHSHILPAQDHGSDSESTSRAQLEIISRAGVREVVATPHFYAHRENVDTFLLRRAESAKILAPHAEELGIRAYLGAEVLLCPGMEHMEGLERLCIEGTNTLLLELPFAHWSNDLISTVYNISRMDFRVVIAHIDRYLKRDISQIFEINNLKYQINASSLCHFRGRREILSLIDEGVVYAIGSDLHGTNGYGDFRKALKVMGEQRVAAIAEKTQRLLPRKS